MFLEKLLFLIFSLFCPRQPFWHLTYGTLCIWIHFQYNSIEVSELFHSRYCRIGSDILNVSRALRISSAHFRREVRFSFQYSSSFAFRFALLGMKYLLKSVHGSWLLTKYHSHRKPQRGGDLTIFIFTSMDIRSKDEQVRELGGK